ncbi:MAG TPA: hypothetical protein VFI65_15170 [Streptosporangiaceae bacterium]|nr:hypothetical protein [Streptosporangiaceae bacterium]
MPDEHALAVFALVDWLLTEAFGAFMLISWIASGGNRARSDRPGTVPRWVIFGHAGLAFAGLVAWISFVVTGDPALAWTSFGLLAPAVGLGISTVTLWTPYPSGQPVDEPRRPQFDGLLGITSDEALTRVLEDEALTTKLIDDLVESMLAKPAPALRRPRVQFSPLIPAAHGLLAMTTILFAVLAAVAAR